MANDRQSNPRPLNCSGLHAVDIEPPMRCIPVLLAAAACLAMVEGASARNHGMRSEVAAAGVVVMTGGFGPFGWALV